MRTRRISRAAVFAAVAWAVAVPAAGASASGRDGLHGGLSPSVATGLETDAASRPLGIDDAKPRLGWRLRSPARGTVQTAFQVIVLREALAPGDDGLVVWDSGRVDGSTPSVEYAGPALESRTRYSWSVRVWDQRGRPSRWSRPAWFETAFMQASEWHAAWIGGPQIAPREGCRVGLYPPQPPPFVRTDCVEPAPRLRTEFDVTKRVARARLYASGLAYGVYYVNGRRVSDAVLDPAITEYTDRAFYVTHDVTRLVQNGENAIGAELGRGYYGSIGFTWANWATAPWHSDPELRLELHVTYRDGSTAVVRSGPGWKATDGPTRFDDFLYGETYDARRAAGLTGWATPEYDDADWSGARPSSGPTGALAAQDVEPIRPQEQLAFRSVRETEPGVYLFDLGENIAGNAILDTDLPEGREITLRYGEKLRPNGRVENCLIPGDCLGMDYQSDRYVGGPGRDVWRPEFSYKGFQYVEVEGLPAPPDVSVLRAEVWHTDARGIGSFESSNGLLNRIVRNTRRAVLSNLMGMPTDTPIYEKTGYTGDGQLMAPSNSYLFDLRRLYAKWTVDIRQSQAPATGELPVWAPSPSDPNGPSNDNPSFPGPSPGWDAALFVVPDVLLRFYGEDRPARQALEEMKKYRAWYDRNALPNGILVEGCANPTGSPCPNGLGDWSNPTGTVKGVTLDNTAWYFYMLGLMERVATLAGDQATATSAHERAAHVFEAFQERFWDPVTRTYRNDAGQTVFSQHQNAIALGLGLVPADRVQSVGDALAADVRTRGNHLATGIIGTRFLWHALTMTGHLEEAFAVATQTTYPSYGYWIDELGYTSLGENWEADTRSHNHHMFGTVVQWLFDTLAGYKPLKPGYEQIEYRPTIPTNGLDWVHASTNTVRGTVATQWRKVRRGLNLDIEVPANATGLVYIPAERPRDVFESGTGRVRPARNARGVQLVGREGDRIVYRVGSGKYKFRIRRSGD